MGRRATPVQISEQQQGILQRLAQASTTGQDLAVRARIVLMSAAGVKNLDQAMALRVHQERVSRHNLDVYRCALQLYRKVGQIVAQFPRGESDFRNQMKRAARSVPFNIGEGVGKRAKARAASYEVALGEDKELIVALDCVEIDGLASLEDVIEAQDLADRIAAMLTRLIDVSLRSDNRDP